MFAVRCHGKTHCSWLHEPNDGDIEGDSPDKEQGSIKIQLCVRARGNPCDHLLAVHCHGPILVVPPEDNLRGIKCDCNRCRGD